MGTTLQGVQEPSQFIGMDKEWLEPAECQDQQTGSGLELREAVDSLFPTSVDVTANPGASTAFP